MDYQRIYDELIPRAVVRHGHPAAYTQKKNGHANHHIRPVSWFEGGRKNPEANQPENLCFLTHREHFVAYWALARLHGGSMALAFAMMCRDGRYKSNLLTTHLYEHYVLEGIGSRKINKAWQENHLAGIRKVIQDPEWKQKNLIAVRRRAADPTWQEQNNARLNILHANPEYRANQVERLKALTQDPQWCERNAKFLKGIQSDPEFKARQKRSQKPEWEEAQRKRGYDRAKLIAGDPTSPGDALFLKANAMMKLNGFQPIYILDCIKGRRKTHKGYTWRYATAEEIAEFERQAA